MIKSWSWSCRHHPIDHQSVQMPEFFQSLRQWQRSDTVELWVYHSPVMWTPPAKSPGEFGGKKQREPCCIRSSRSWKSPFLYACLRYRHVQSHVFRRVQGRETINLSRTAWPAWLRMRFGTENFKGGKRFSESCKDCRFWRLQGCHQNVHEYQLMTVLKLGSLRICAGAIGLDLD